MTVRLGLISDTHMPGTMSELWPSVVDAFDSVDGILHAGDLHTADVIDQLNAIAPTYVARGNGDFGVEHTQLRDVWLLEFAGVYVGMVHEFPNPERAPAQKIARYLSRAFAERKPDVVIYGHTHFEQVHVLDELLCVNPGSPTLPRNRSFRPGTIGFLEITDGAASASIHQLRGPNS